MRSAPGPQSPGSSGADRDAAILAAGVSKSYPGRRVIIFPPVLSIFERDLNPFSRGRSDEQPDARRRSQRADGYDLDDDEDDEDEDDLEIEDAIPPSRAGPDEMFWALKDISLRVRPGTALGVVGGPGAGKSTLLRILGGRAFPTEGRVLVRGEVAPLAAEVHKALALSGKKGDDLVLAARLVGVERELAKRHRDEIEELAQPLEDADGEPERGARTRLGVAMAAVLPASVILLDDTRGLDDAFVARIFDRLRERVRSGSALVFASRQPELVQALCDEVIVLHEGVIVGRGDAGRAVGLHAAAPNGGQSAKGKSAALATRPAIGRSERTFRGEEIQVPPVASAFNSVAALMSAVVESSTGVRSKHLHSDDELAVEIRLETAFPDTEMECGVCFMPRAGGTGFRLELPEPLRLAHPATYVLVARLLPGTLRGGGYEVRADATVAGGAEPGAAVIARNLDRLRIVGDDFTEPAEPPVAQWDGSDVWIVEAEWSVRQESRRA